MKKQRFSVRPIANAIVATALLGSCAGNHGAIEKDAHITEIRASSPLRKGERTEIVVGYALADSCHHLSRVLLEEDPAAREVAVGAKQVLVYTLLDDLFGRTCHPGYVEEEAIVSFTPSVSGRLTFRSTSGNRVLEVTVVD